VARVILTLALLTLLAALSLWIRSYFARDSIGIRSERGAVVSCVLSSQQGIIKWHYCCEEVRPHLSRPNVPRDYSWKRTPVSSDFPLVPYIRGAGSYWRGFGYARDSWSVPPISWRTRVTEYALTLPHWTLALLTALLPLYRGARWWCRRRRDAKGLCPVCGYDLRSSGGRCPECGTVTSGGSHRKPKRTFLKGVS